MARKISIGVFCLFSSSAEADPSRYFSFAQPTERYAHGVLGDDVEYGALQLRKAFFVEMIEAETASGQRSDPRDFSSFLILAEQVLPTDRVFEDLQPRVADLNGDGRDEIIVVESQAELGAQLAVYQLMEIGAMRNFYKLAATPHIGTRYRWLAPAGIADFDGDGQNDIAYVETPHLGKILKIVTLKGDQLVPIVTPMAGFSNHSIGEDFITSGVRDCAGRVELLTPDAARTTLMAVRVESGDIVSVPTAFEPSLAGIAQAQRCGG